MTQNAISVHLASSFDYLELVRLKDRDQDIEQSVSIPIPEGVFDPVSRQVQDENELTRLVKELFDTHRVPTNQPTVLVLPSFYTRQIELPEDVPTDELRMSLLSEAERFYAFKRVEPQISWLGLHGGQYLYSAFPKVAIEQWSQAFLSLQIPLVRVELNYLSLLRGLVATGSLTAEVEQDRRWCLVVLLHNEFFALVAQGLRIERVIETPLTVSGVDPVATMQDICADLAPLLSEDPLTKLVLINNTAHLPTQVLLDQLGFPGVVVVIEQNAETLQSRGEPTAMFPCSLEAIGGVFARRLTDLPSMNFALESGEDLWNLKQLRQKATRWLMVANAAVLLLCGVVWVLFGLVTWAKDAQYKQMVQASQQAEQLPQGMNALWKQLFVEQAVEHNIQLNNVLVKAGTALPDTAWLNALTLEFPLDMAAIGVSLAGGAQDPKSVNSFHQALMKATQLDHLEIQKLDLNTANPAQPYYAWLLHSRQPAAEPAKGAPQPGPQPPSPAPGPPRP